MRQLKIIDHHRRSSGRVRSRPYTREKSLNELTAVLYIEAATVAATVETIFIEIDTCMYIIL